MQRGLALILIVIIVAVLGIGGYFVYTSLRGGVADVAISPTPSPTPTGTGETVYTESDRSANWKTYTNNIYKYYFKYPKEAKIIEGGRVSEVDGVLLKNPAVTSLITNEFQLSIYLENNNLNKDIKQLKQEILIDPNITVLRANESLEDIEVDNYIVDGESAYGGGLPSARGYYKIILLHNNKIFNFDFSEINSNAKIILSTFKFTQ